jgi:hypothetical protein
MNVFITNVLKSPSIRKFPFEFGGFLHLFSFDVGFERLANETFLTVCIAVQTYCAVAVKNVSFASLSNPTSNEKR